MSGNPNPLILKVPLSSLNVKRPLLRSKTLKKPTFLLYSEILLLQTIFPQQVILLKTHLLVDICSSEESNTRISILMALEGEMMRSWLEVLLLT